MNFEYMAANSISDIPNIIYVKVMIQRKRC